MSKNTKLVSLSQEFLRAAAGNEEQALAYMLYSAFGVTLVACCEIVRLVLANKDAKMIVLMMTAGVQVRGNVVFVGREYGNVRVNYPGLVIEGNREVKDHFNFGALHVCGHLLAKITTHSLGKLILGKAGDCIDGAGFPANEAGKINKEIFDSWSPDDKAAAARFLLAVDPIARTHLDQAVGSFHTMSTEFSTKMSGKSVPSAFTAPIVTASTKGPAAEATPPKGLV